MITDKAILERIVEEVLARLYPAAEPTRPVKPGLLLVYPGELEAKAVDIIEKELQAGWNVYHARVEEIEHVSLHRDVKQTVFLETSQDLIVQGALGLTGTVESRLLAEALLAGIPALLVPCVSLKWLLHPKTGDAVLSQSAKRYRQHIRAYTDTLRSFGATLGSIADVLALADEEARMEERAEKGGMPRLRPVVFEGKVLTHSDVQQAKEGVIYVSPSTVITPLARDAARAGGVTIQVDEG
ncbi:MULTISPECIES: hypothetical protein [Aneurinibacillus]|uniref:Uncharacterized protein n=1 Tax=Aneurinibacillus thermoaerophilus TaxID=143495 RepID=A0A1G7X6G2_ANETH|nr:MULTISPECIES: hypothetical protein [Aneurinibacillus]AMA73223.1 hypothetical protein ACH33_10365 [Aneurinibacillus sp. XH2]MED0674351.1 hypothetical protein [Aneurinibacillus thermoaerophilus]MED0678369.1 hypothetical protein [Aneurinibacillus thermoaerophilus]MED0736106.1 hypothetical protein [Aneurinibacillus thermoaerophilus]MED0756950.1 hypothetical protein [Aneurinibacillus thermoaerophilus]